MGSLNRADLVQDSNKQVTKEGNFEFKIVLDYNIQYRQFEKIVNKHWEVLKKDKVLGTVLPAHPRFIYRKAPSLRDVVAPGVIDPPPPFKENRIFNFLSGFYACGRCQSCKQCKFNIKKRKEFTSFSTKKSYTIKNLITCNTEGVIYMLECDCGLQYIGRTSRSLAVRVGEHVNNIKNGFRYHSVSRHFKQYHNKNPKCLKFWGLEKVNRHWRGGNYTRHISQRESFWIFEAKVLTPEGLNVDFDLNCFISNK